jgi:transcriptional regulator GlxA family with amidase domain
MHQIQNWAELAKKANWNAGELARVCEVSLRTLERYFLKQIGVSPKTWLVKERQRQAAELLRAGHSVKEAAGLLCFRSSSHFTNGFKKYWGHCPTDERTRTFEEAS